VEDEMMTRLLLLGAIIASFQRVSAQCPSMEGPPGDLPEYSLRLPAQPGPVKAGSPVWVEVVLTNPLDREIAFYTTTNTNINFEPIIVSNENGKPLPDKRPGFRDGRFDLKHVDPKLIESGEIITLLSGKIVCIRLKPGESHVRAVEISKFYDMTTPGRYTVSRAEDRPAQAAAAKSNRAAARSSSVQVLVTK
jgi:hypothetical protein